MIRRSMYLLPIIFLLSVTVLSGSAYAATIDPPTITAPTEGSSYNIDDTFTLSVDSTCSGSSGKCKNTDLTANLPSGLSTTDSNPQSCGTVKRTETCSKSWTVSADSAGTYSITVDADSSNSGSATSSSISVTVNAEEEETGESSSETTSSTTTTDTSQSILTVEIISPSQGEVFNRGDDVLIKASVSSTDVLVKGTLGQTLTLFDDGQHGDDGFQDGIYANTVNVPPLPEGNRELKVRVEEKNKAGEDSISVVISDSLQIDDNLKDSYSQGEEIEFTSTVSDATGDPLPDADVIISANIDDYNFNLETTTDDNGDIDESYIISFLDPVGNWTVNMTAVDSEGNSGSKIFLLPVGPPSGGLSYTAKFTSPVPTVIYKRGDSVPIFVEVFEAGKALPEAEVSVRTAGGDVVKLREITDGSYAGEYTLKFDDPIDDFSLSAIAVKDVEGKIKGGGNKVDLAVEPAKLKLELITPGSGEFTVGQKVKISARALYPDGTLGKDLAVTALTPLNDSIAMEEVDPGIYQATYKLKEGEEGPWLVSVEAIDANVNSGETRQLIQVAPITPLYLILQYWWAILAGASPGIYYAFLRGRVWYTDYRIDGLKEKLEKITKMKKSTQTKYFKEGTINKSTHDRLMSDYEDERERAMSDLAKLKIRRKKI